MNKIDIFVYTIVILCALLILGFNCTNQPKRNLIIHIDSPTINIWQEVEDNHLSKNDPDREFDFKYDLVSLSERHTSK